MDSLSVISLLSSLPIKTHLRTNNPNPNPLFFSHQTIHFSRNFFKTTTAKTTLFFQLFPSNQTKPFQNDSKIPQNPNSFGKITSFVKNSPTHFSNPPQIHQKFVNSLNFQLSFALFELFLSSLPSSSFAFETETTLSTTTTSDKINLESILISINDFLNQNPFFVAGITFIWLVVIPLTQEYLLKKFKFVSAIDAFRKLRDDPNSQLLDIRDKQSLLYIGSPNLKILNKKTIQIPFIEGEKEKQGFVKKVLENFKDPVNTSLCIIDNFDGKSIEVAELLIKNGGFKNAYAIKNGLRGKDGWQAIQETLLPPSVHVFPEKNSKAEEQLSMKKEGTKKQDTMKKQISSSDRNELTKNGAISSIPTSEASLGVRRPSSPYANYPDMKPPSSPSPSKPVTRK